MAPGGTPWRTRTTQACVLFCVPEGRVRCTHVSWLPLGPSCACWMKSYEVCKNSELFRCALVVQIRNVERIGAEYRPGFVSVVSNMPMAAMTTKITGARVGKSSEQRPPSVLFYRNWPRVGKCFLVPVFASTLRSVLSFLVVPCVVMSCHVLSCLVLACLDVAWLVSSCLFLS